MKITKQYTYPVIISFVSYIVIIMIISLFTEPGDYNQKEKRNLMQRPTIYSAVSYDQFADDMDLFLVDQFPFRDKIIQAQQDAILASGEDVVIGDLYVLSSDYIFCHTHVLQPEEVITNAEAIATKMKETGIPFYYNIVPQKNLLFAEIEPMIDAGVDQANIDLTISTFEEYGIPVIDSCKYFQAFSMDEIEKCFFKTDYHWNEYGAYNGAEYLIKSLASQHVISKTSVPIDDDFVWSDLTGRKYLGDLRKQVSSEVTVEEYLPMYKPVNYDDLKYYTDFSDREVPRDSIMFTGVDDEVLEYNAMACNNPAYLRIENPFAAEDQHVLFIRDSNECTMRDYLCTVFTETNYVDPRFMTAADIDKIIEERDIDFVVLIYQNSTTGKELSNYLNK